MRSWCPFHREAVCSCKRLRDSDASLARAPSRTRGPGASDRKHTASAFNQPTRPPHKRRSQHPRSLDDRALSAVLSVPPALCSASDFRASALRRHTHPPARPRSAAEARAALMSAGASSDGVASDICRQPSRVVLRRGGLPRHQYFISRAASLHRPSAYDSQWAVHLSGDAEQSCTTTTVY